MNSILYIDDNGKAELYDDDYNITIFCKDEQEQQRAMKRLETANRMRGMTPKPTRRRTAGTSSCTAMASAL